MFKYKMYAITDTITIMWYNVCRGFLGENSVTYLCFQCVCLDAYEFSY